MTQAHDEMCTKVICKKARKQCYVGSCEKFWVPVEWNRNNGLRRRMHLVGM